MYGRSVFLRICRACNRAAYPKAFMNFGEKVRGFAFWGLEFLFLMKSKSILQEEAKRSQRSVTSARTGPGDSFRPGLAAK